MSTEKEILSGLLDVLSYAEGTKKPARITRIVPVEVDVASIRERLNLSQLEFASRYGFPIGTVRNWEQGRRFPEGAARLLLKLIDTRPDVIERLLNEGDGKLASA